MRQAGRYMAAFREYSDKYPFRMRSETPDIAIELSLQVRAARMREWARALGRTMRSSPWTRMRARRRGNAAGRECQTHR